MQLAELLAQLEPYNARLVAVSKKKPDEAVLELYAQGQRDFGENRVQDFTDRQERLPRDIRWHFIGHLQSKKVKDIAPFVALIHSVDSGKLLEEINKRAAENGRVIDCLLQFKIAREESKYGLGYQEGVELLQSPVFSTLRHVRIIGVMGMATFTDDEAVVRAEFQRLKSIFNDLKQQFFAADPAFREISMGMSDDYPIALEEGSTMVRIGSLLFGPR